MKKTLLFILSLNFLACYSQENKKTNAKKLDADYLKIIYKECASPDIIDVEYTIDDYIEVEYTCDGELFEIGIKNNSLMYLERSVDATQVPYDIIKRKIEKKYLGWLIDEILEVKTNDTLFLKFEIVKDGVEQNIYFTKDGKWFKFTALDVSDKWDIIALEHHKNYTATGYNFFKPDSIYEMSDLLREISGIAYHNDETIYCVQDELGAIFKYDLKKQEIVHLYRFSDIGDFEDISIKGDKALVLRSDGLLFSYDLAKQQLISTTMLPLNALNIEGLCVYNNFVYTANKSAQINQPENKRSIYQIDENNMTQPKLFLETNLDEIIAFIQTNYPELAVSSLQFNPSALAFHPKTKELYILSATDRLLTIYKDKKLKNVILLPSATYYKPEGLSFTENGDLYISSEGDKNCFVRGSIMLFKQ
jgi:uncharacterized protein YjiK